MQTNFSLGRSPVGDESMALGLDLKISKLDVGRISHQWLPHLIVPLGGIEWLANTAMSQVKEINQRWVCGFVGLWVCGFVGL